MIQLIMLFQLSILFLEHVDDNIQLRLLEEGSSADTLRAQEPETAARKRAGCCLRERIPSAEAK